MGRPLGKSQLDLRSPFLSLPCTSTQKPAPRDFPLPLLSWSLSSKIRCRRRVLQKWTLFGGGEEAGWLLLRL